MEIIKIETNNPRTMHSIKVGLVQINNAFPGSYYLPYSVGLLQAHFQKYGNNSKVFEFIEPIFSRMPVNKIVTHLKEANIVAFSTYSWNFLISLAIAKRLSEKNPDVMIVFGGPHVPNDAEKLLRENLFIDIACHGEGERTFTKILENYCSKKYKDIPSISYLDKGNYIKNPDAPRINNLSDIPSPYLEGTFDKLIHHKGYQQMALWETNRGCPFTCAYCDWGSYTKSQLYAFDIERLKKEVDWFAKNKIEFIYCCDANFGILERDLDIVQYVAETKKRYGYPKSLAVHDTKNASERTYAIQKVLYDAGLSKGVSLALQTIDKTTLENIERQNISLDSFRKLQRKFNRDHLETYTDVLQGLPGETYNSYTNGVSQIIDMGQHNRIRFSTLFILPNALMGDPQYQKKHGFVIVETKNKMQHSSLDSPELEIEEIQHNVVGTKTMPKDDWVKAKVFSWWCSLLYFDKILQIPFLLLHEIYGFNYNKLFETFFIENSNDYPITSKIQKIFFGKAKSTQCGGKEYCGSPEWLNLYWPPDEYIFIKLMVEKKLEGFYREAEDILHHYLKSRELDIPSFLHEAITLNRYLIKKPFQNENITLQMEYNIWESYMAALTMEKINIKKGRYLCHINCTDEIWTTWNDWLREVVWYGNKQGTYLYPVESIQNNL